MPLPLTKALDETVLNEESESRRGSDSLKGLGATGYCEFACRPKLLDLRNSVKRISEGWVYRNFKVPWCFSGF